ncbi:hypothetical protein BGK72_34160 [Streptomyces agglomeratus]|nr:hypothetical protein BGK72_34160 [Streptomyces agglomeratus]
MLRESVYPPPTDFGLSGCGWCLEGQAGAGYEAVEGMGTVLQAFEAVADEGFELVKGHDGKVGQAAFDVGPHAFDGVQVG